MLVRLRIGWMFALAVALGPRRLRHRAAVRRRGAIAGVRSLFGMDANEALVAKAGALPADAYSYLPNSVKRFPSPALLAAEMARAGLCDISYLLTAGGIVAIHAGTVPAEEA